MTMDKIEEGQSGEIEVEVTADMSVNRTGIKGAEVLSTPSLLMLMEKCCIEASDALLPKTHTTVGYAVDGMRHLAPTSVGSKVTVKTMLTEVDGNKLTYTLEAFEGDKSIGIATHRRAVIAK